MKHNYYRTALRSSLNAKRGRVKWYRPETGFGFILPEGGGADVFLHYTALVDPAREPADGAEVLWTGGMQNGKFRALQVWLV